MIAGAMSGGLDAFVGRDDELVTLGTAVRGAAAGHGSVSFVCGEAGIGKSRLVEELARRVGSDHVVAWGRCWEEGGAPPYWPWTQVLRTLLRRNGIGTEPLLAAGRGPWLVQLVPDLADRVDAQSPPLEPDQARFRLLDAAVGALCDAAERQPLLVILEDMHAADASSVKLLEFLARQIRGARVAVVGTLREQEARRSAAYPVLSRLQREARHVALAPLGRDDVQRFLAEALGRAPEGRLVEAMMETTEGNPLFLSEIARRRAGLESVERRGGAPVIPQSVQMAIAERFEELDPATRELLVVASTLGREVSTASLAEVSEADRGSMARAMAEAVDHAVVVEVAPDLFRFSHTLIRETLHQTLDDERRQELHRRMAQSLERAGGAQWSQIAHHFVEAGPVSRRDAVRALRHAAGESVSRFAFAEAAGLLRQALELVPDAVGDPDDTRFELLLALASALHHAGETRPAIDACDAAVEEARRLEEPELFARAALERGAVFEIGKTSDVLINLLEESLDRLDPGDSATRSQVMARLAAARQPSAPPERQFELARRGIAMARRVGDERALLDALRTGVSALMDLADPHERLALNREHAALAEKLGEPLAVLQAHGRMLFDAAELGEPSVVNASIDTCGRIVEDLDLDPHRWRVSAMRAMCALFEGRFDDANAHAEAARARVASASEPWAGRTLKLQAYHRARLQGRYDEALDLLDRVDPDLQPFAFGRSAATILRAAVLAESGRLDAARALWSDELVEWPLALGDLSMLEACTEIALAVDSRQLHERLLARLQPEAHRFMSWGIFAAAIGPPAAGAVGRLLVSLGEAREGEQHLREALARARAVRGLPHVAQLCLHLAALPSARDGHERAREALELSEELGMPGLADRARGRLLELEPRAARGDRAARSEPAVPTVAHFEMRREGGIWVFDCDGESFHLKDLKGLALLSRLVEAQGRELHVLDLESPTGAAAAHGSSDAGEAIDDEAKQAYRRRVVELREEMEEAEAWNDLGRIERARAELESIEAELSRSVGLGGRTRRSSSQTERARVNVQRRLKDAIRRIGEQHPALGKHLSWAVRTGTFCSYRPD